MGVDVGATKIAAGAVTGTRIRNLIVRATPHETKKALVRAIAEAVTAAAAGPVPSAVGIGMPYGTDGLPHAGPALLPDLRKEFGRTIRLENDANCAAFGEARARRAKHLVMFTLGTGFGAGVIIDGTLFRGADGLGSEFGNTTIDYDYGGPAASYNPGRLHDLVSGSGLVAEAAAAASAPEAEGYLAGLLERQDSITALDVTRATRSGDAAAVSIMERFAVRLGVGIANAVNTFQPRHVVLGGGLADQADLYLDLAMQEAARRAMTALWENVTVSVSKLEQAGVVGAAALAREA
ncbi:MAG: ROK family protein [bacterium]|nr:ROK family protein [bacterium]